MKRGLVLLAALAAWTACAGAATVTLLPSADTFVRAAAPDTNYGSQGALSVAGASALNGSGASVGLAQTFMQFELAAAVASLDSQFGSHAWTVTGVSLKVVESAAPPNAVFGRGQGQFGVQWLAADAWTESGLTWNTRSSYLSPGTDAALGTFTNLFQGDQYAPVQSFPLATPAAFTDDLRAGGSVSLLLAAASDSIGFTFNARDITGARVKPVLEITAVPEPATAGVLAALAVTALRRRGRKA